MGMTLIYGLIFLMTFETVAVGLFIYAKKKNSKIALTVSIIMIVFVISVLLTNSIDEFSISKKDITTDLKRIDIELKDDFKISNNKISGMPERIQETEIQISKADKDRIINEIKNFPNCKRYKDFYSIETYMEIDNIPTRIFAQINYNDNTIKYQRLED